jgi:hypothetical protein
VRRGVPRTSFVGLCPRRERQAKSRHGGSAQRWDVTSFNAERADRWPPRGGWRKLNSYGPSSRDAVLGTWPLVVSGRGVLR